jgi:hypothetical protein
LWDVQQIAGVLDDHEPITGGERPGEVRWHDRDSIAAVHEDLTFDELGERLGHRSLRRGDLIDG